MYLFHSIFPNKFTHYKTGQSWLPFLWVPCHLTRFARLVWARVKRVCSDWFVYDWEAKCACPHELAKRTHLLWHTHIGINTHTRMHTHTYTHTRTHMWTRYIDPITHTHMLKHTHKYTHTHTHTPLHTHTHTHSGVLQSLKEIYRSNHPHVTAFHGA